MTPFGPSSEPSSPTDGRLEKGLGAAKAVGSFSNETVHGGFGSMFFFIYICLVGFAVFVLTGFVVGRVCFFWLVGGIVSWLQGGLPGGKIFFGWCVC